MTELQLKLLEYYKQYYKEQGTYPSITEAATYFNQFRQNVKDRADSLVNHGYFKKVRAGVYIPTRKR